MDDRLNATANVYLNSVCVQMIFRSERTHEAVHQYGREHVLLNDVLAKNFCHILRMHMDVLLVHRPWPIHALRLLEFPLLD